MKNKYNYSKNNHCKCGKLIHNLSKSCRKCADKQHSLRMSGKGNSNWKGGINNRKKYYCINCKTKISKKEYKKCPKCFGKKHSKRMKGKNNPMFGKIARTKRIYYKKYCMRSSWEIAYAKWLDKNKIKWLYEKVTFNLGNITYTPDFYLSERNRYIEIKGYFSKIGKRKFYLFKQMYPKIHIQLLKRKDLQQLKIIK